MAIRESPEVVAHRLLARDFGPDLAVILPREHWQITLALLSFVHDMVDETDDTPVGKVIDEMRAYAVFAMDRAILDSMRADKKVELGGGM